MAIKIVDLKKKTFPNPILAIFILKLNFNWKKINFYLKT